MSLAYDRLHRGPPPEERLAPCPTPATSSSSAPAPPATPPRCTPPGPASHPLVFEGSVTAGGALMNTTEVENFPGLPRRHHGPGPDGRDARPGRALRRRAGPRRRRRGRPHRRRQGRQDRHRHLHRPRGDPGHGLRLPQARPAPRGGALRPRRLLVRDLRRLLLPRPAHRGRRRRRLRHRGGHLPDPVRLQGLPDRAPRRAARLQDHAGARLRRPQARDRLELRGRRDQRRRPARVGDPARHRDRRDPRRSTRPGCSSRSATTRARSC